MTVVVNPYPSLVAQHASDEVWLCEDVLAVRKQTAVVMALADELEHLAPWRPTSTLRQQLVEELARLGCRILETAATLSRTTEPGPVSGILPTSSGDNG